METYSAERYRIAGISMSFVQDNHSMSRDVGVLRGLHWQSPPHAQDKIVRCVRGAIWDVALDIRQSSPTFGSWVAAELSEANAQQLFIPTGFAHGYLTLLPDTEVVYKVSAAYAPEFEGGVIWDDPAIAIEWPAVCDRPRLSEKDEGLPRLADIISPFVYHGDPLQPLAI